MGARVRRAPRAAASEGAAIPHRDRASKAHAFIEVPLKCANAESPLAQLGLCRFEGVGPQNAARSVDERLVVRIQEMGTWSSIDPLTEKHAAYLRVAGVTIPA